MEITSATRERWRASAIKKKIMTYAWVTLGIFGFILSTVQLLTKIPKEQKSFSRQQSDEVFCSYTQFTLKTQTIHTQNVPTVPIFSRQKREVIIIVSNWRHRPISDDSITRRIQRGDSIRFSACCLNFDTAALETNSGLNYDLI